MRKAGQAPAFFVIVELRNHVVVDNNETIISIMI